MPNSIPPRCEVIPETDHEVSFRIDGLEVTRWALWSAVPASVLLPVDWSCRASVDSDGTSRGRQTTIIIDLFGFPHNKVLGIDFWSDNTNAAIRQTQWFVYEDGDTAASMAVELGWFDGHDPQPLVDQELIVTLRPASDGYTLDLQSTFHTRAAQLEFQKTHYGFLAVRVAKSLSGHFGSGVITGSSGGTGEPSLFGQANRWVDYSGPVAGPVQGESRPVAINGITYHDHPLNPNFPAKWHVREDGWMGASACRESSLITRRTEPLVLRYLLTRSCGENVILSAQMRSLPNGLSCPGAGSSNRNGHTSSMKSRSSKPESIIIAQGASSLAIPLERLRGEASCGGSPIEPGGSFV